MFQSGSKRQEFSSLIGQTNFIDKGVTKLSIPHDDVNLILGGNAVTLFGLEDKVPLDDYSKEYLQP